MAQSTKGLPVELISSSDLKELSNAHKFVRDDEFDEKNKGDWRVRMARRYYDKLYKEYVIVDLSRYKEQMFGLRWRTEDEVLSGKGQTICGAKQCNGTTGLRSYEMPFRYLEDNNWKCELVKVRVCPICGEKLTSAKPSRKRKTNSEVESEEIKEKKKS